MKWLLVFFVTALAASAQSAYTLSTAKQYNVAWDQITNYLTGGTVEADDGLLYLVTITGNDKNISIHNFLTATNFFEGLTNFFTLGRGRYHLFIGAVLPDGTAGEKEMVVLNWGKLPGKVTNIRPIPVATGK